MSTLFALCRNSGALQVRRVRVAQPLQQKIFHIFQTQAASFFDGIEEEIEFDGGWKPDSNEVLVMPTPDEANAIFEALDNPIALPTVDPRNFASEGIKALITADENERVFIQAFTAQQLLSRRFSLMLEGDIFRELTEPAFTLENKLVAVIEARRLKFKSFFQISRIFDLTFFYFEASDQEIENFCGHSHLSVIDVHEFKNTADQIIRKLIHTIARSNVLNKHSVEDIASKATSLGLDVQLANGKIVMPNDRKTIKQLLRFLDDCIYEASLTSRKYVTNSKRPLM